MKNSGKTTVLFSAALSLSLIGLPGCASILDEPPASVWRPSQAMVPVTEQPSSATIAILDKVQGPLTLTACLAHAMAENPGLKAVADEAGAAAADSRSAQSARWPKLDAVSGYTHNLDNQRLVGARYNGESGAFGRDNLSAELVLTMPLYTGGQLTHQLRAAQLLEMASSHRLSRSRHELSFNVTSLFYSILAQQQLIESIQMSERAITEQHQRIRQLVQVQKAAQVDLLRIEVRLAQIQEQLITERNRLAIQQRTMGVLLGLAQQSIQIDGQLDADTTTSVPLPVLSEVLTQRQDYQAASAGVEAQRHQLDAVKGANLPQISARASYGGRLGLDADHPDGVDDLEDVATVGIVGSVRLFDAGLNDAQILRQRFALSAGRQRLLELEQRIDLECQTAWLNVQAAVKRIGATSAAVRQADESLRIEREKYDQGKGTIVDILDAQAASLQAQTTYHRVLADRHIAQAQLQLATGAMP